MNTHTLKRPRALGDELESSDSLIHPPPVICPLHSQFINISATQQASIEQAASLYGLTHVQLHWIVCNSIYGTTSSFQPNPYKRSKSTYSTAPHHPVHGLCDNDLERMSQMRPSDQALESVAPNASLTGSYQLGMDGSRMITGLASLKNACNCLGRCNGQDGYYQIPTSLPYPYEPNTPYAVEKPPSMDVVTSGEFVTGALKTPNPPSFIEDGTPAAGYLANFPALQPGSQSNLGQQDNREQPHYDSQPAVGDYYANESHLGAGLAMTPGMARPGPMMQEHAISVPQCSPQFSDALPHQHSDGGPDNAAARYTNIPGYGGRTHVAANAASYPDMMHRGSTFDVMLTNPLNRPAARRGPFKNNDDREKTAQTRKIGSCVRCRMQRIRCLINPAEPNGPCLTCQKVSANTKIRRLPCLRYKITDVRLFKPGQVRGFEWTRRWRDNIVDNISHWASDEIRIIQVSEGYTGRPVELRVRKFIPQEGDKLERSWVVNGTKKSVAIPPYAIVDLEAARKAYSEHIDRGIVECFSAIVKSRNSLLWRTYILAWKMAQDPKVSQDEKDLLLLTLRLWVAVRLTTKSTVIIGEETLGMPPNIMDDSSPIHGCIPLPPVMGAQLDLILIHQIQSALRRELLDKLQKMIQTNKQKTWLTSYLVTFILLHNVALITNHDASYARKHGIQKRFAREDKVREYHLGANILLAYFHYCNKGIYPFSNECKEQDLRTLAELDDAMINFVKETRSYAVDHKRQWETLHREGRFEDDHFFVSQLFTENWEPRTTV